MDKLDSTGSSRHWGEGFEDFHETVRQRLELQDQLKSGQVIVTDPDDTLKMYRPFTICECDRLNSLGLCKATFSKVLGSTERCIARCSDGMIFKMKPKDFEGLKLVKCDECIEEAYQLTKKKMMDERLKHCYKLFDSPQFKD